MDELIEQFKNVQEELGLEDREAAILVLAYAIKSNSAFNRANAENFGHELALALKNVLSEETVRVSLSH